MNCDNLSSITDTPNLEYADIQSIWNLSCIGCHATDTPAADLDLSNNSLRNIVNVESLQAPGRTQVIPFDAETSYLFEKINCSTPEIGVRMPLSSTISLANQALIRDWINQGAPQTILEQPEPPISDSCVIVRSVNNGNLVTICF